MRVGSQQAKIIGERPPLAPRLCLHEETKAAVVFTCDRKCHPARVCHKHQSGDIRPPSAEALDPTSGLGQTQIFQENGRRDECPAFPPLGDIQLSSNKLWHKVRGTSVELTQRCSMRKICQPEAAKEVV